MARASRIALDMALEASKTLKTTVGIAWQYAKIEIVPPFTMNFFHGPKGKYLEDTISKATNNFIAGIKTQIHEIESEKVNEIKRKEAAAKALVEKLKAEARRKAEETKKKAEEIAKKVKAEAQKKAKAATKAASDAKTKAKVAKEVITKKVVTVANRRKPSKHRRENKKDSSRKPKK